MHFGFALELSDIELWNIDLLDTHLDLLDTDIPSKYFVSLHSVFKTFSRYVFKTSWRQVFKTSSRHVFKKSSRRLGRRKIVTLKTCWRSLEDVFKTNKCLLDWECAFNFSQFSEHISRSSCSQMFFKIPQ